MLDTLLSFGVTDSTILSRIQFAANISFHILFPTITIALGWYLFYFKIRQHITPHPQWQRAYRFWIKIFALTFALGVVSGITMSFQFGTNWPGFMETVGNIAGPLLGYEVLTAFFLEATFLGIMLFGQSRVPPWLHTLATGIVAVGTMLSAFWILALNSWLHTPAGFEMREGIAYPTDWWAIIFNPSFPYRFGHMMIASLLTASFLIAGLSAYRLLKGDSKATPKATLKQAIIVVAIAAPLQLIMGDLHGLNTFKHQPQKIAAMEGVWETTSGAPLLLFALPDEADRQNRFEFGIPNIASFILTHDLEGEIKGLNEFEHHPPVMPVFISFRVMVATGMLMILTGLIGAYFLLRKKTLPRWYLKLLVGMTFSGWVATLAGWYVTEIGRQPYLVTGVLTVQEAATTKGAGDVGLSLVIYLLLYAVLLIAYMHTLTRMAKKAVDVPEYEDADVPHAPFHKSHLLHAEHKEAKS